jgi:hypothetical protein
MPRVLCLRPSPRQRPGRLKASRTRRASGAVRAGFGFSWKLPSRCENPRIGYWISLESFARIVTHQWITSGFLAILSLPSWLLLHAKLFGCFMTIKNIIERGHRTCGILAIIFRAASYGSAGRLVSRALRSWTWSAQSPRWTKVVLFHKLRSIFCRRLKIKLIS